MEIEKPAISIEQFRKSLVLIRSGDISEFERLQYLYQLTIEQYNMLAEAHEFILKAVK